MAIAAGFAAPFAGCDVAISDDDFSKLDKMLDADFGRVEKSRECKKKEEGEERSYCWEKEQEAAKKADMEAKGLIYKPPQKKPDPYR
eukprot:CAMPEP_0117540662 /NCGR_PEP_ID=MMETSP0784-20121206/43615_1 /TAXON_ID=39447 /ORGANISM="" /LENGTH=86 /DNA_ID=CAMNT_0005337325 /DNA_START=204 /DNA_END=464 /DNA_ORIENTATION=+